MTAPPNASGSVAFDRPHREVPISAPIGSAVLRSPWRIVFALTLIAAIVRSIGLGGGLWIDEIYSLLDSFRPPLKTILTEFSGDTQHPLYSVLANVARSAFGESAWSIRLPAMIFGVASVPALYVLGRGVAGAREGLLAAALLALSYHHVWFSQNARGYTMLGFWAIVSTHLLYQGLRRGRRWRFIWYGVVIGLGVFTHLTMAFLVAAHAPVAILWAVRHRRDDGVGHPAAVLLGLGVGIAIGALLYAPVFVQVLDFFLNNPSDLEGVSTPTWALFEALRVLRVGPGGSVALLGATLLFGSGVLSYARRDPLALSLFVLPGFVTLVGALLVRQTMYPRFYFFLIGFAFLIVIRGAFVVADFIVRRTGKGRPDEGSPRAGTVLALAMVLVSAASLGANYTAPKQDFGGALEYVEAQADPSDVVATVGVTTLPYRQYFGRSFAEVTDLASLYEVRGGGRRVWMLYTFGRYIEAADPALARVLRDDCRIQQIFQGTVGGGDIIVCAFDAAVSYPEEGVP